MELFLAIQLKPQHAQELHTYAAQHFPDVPAELAADLHITLQYLGHTTRVNDICERLMDLCQEPFSLTFSGLGAFNRQNDTDVIWQGIAAPAPGLLSLHRKIGEALEDILPRPDGEYRPHITLGYSPEPVDPNEVSSQATPLTGTCFSVEEFSLCRVLPASSPIRFRTIASFRLSASPVRRTVRLLTVNDFHASLLESSGSLGAAKLLSAVQDYRTRYPDTAVLFGGDNFFGDPVSELFQGKPVLELMQALDVQASVAGNHDFDFPIEEFRTWQSESGIPMLAANLLQADGNESDLTKPGCMLSFGDLRVAVLGLSTQEPMCGADRPQEWSNYQLADVVDTAKRCLAQETKGHHESPDAIVALTHLGLRETREGELIGEEVIRLAENVPALDGIFAAHFHRFIQTQIHGTAVVEGGGNGRGFAVLALTFDGEKQLLSAVPLCYDLAECRTEIQPDPEMAARITNYHQDAKKRLGRKVTFAACRINHRDPVTNQIPLTGTPLTLLATKVMQQYSGCPIAMMYAGRMGNGFDPGEITLYRFYEVFPFANTIVTGKMTGAQIRKNVEIGMRTLPEDGASPLAVGGLCVYLDPEQPVGQRVQELRLPDGQPLQDEQLYDVVFEDYLASDPLGFVFSQATRLTYHEMTMRELLLEHFMSASSLNGEYPNNMIITQKR